MKEIFFYPIVAIIILKLSGFVGKFIGEYEKVSSFSMKEEYPAFNAVYRILFPVVAVFIMGSAFSYFGYFLPHLWLIPIYFCVLKFIFIYVMDRSELANFKYILFTSITTVLISSFVFEISSSDNNFFIPQKNDLVSQFWIMVILFSYKIFDNMRIRGNSSTQKKERLEKYIKMKICRYIDLYKCDIVKVTTDITIIKIIISIMIVEDFNRPNAVRIIERKFPFICKTTGIMQITSGRPLSDKESVTMGSELIKKYYNDTKKEERADYTSDFIIARKVALKYNNSEDYAEMVREAFGYVNNSENESFFKSDSSNRWI
ncbi:MAG: hypothetical protein F8N36_08465 [Desulfovibrio sp.]|uniref:hypothetical protein n=1 Tax=Desulfovibrio sp. TaxID=885 RepID=UPI00135DB760|nr:hypothetical protein [Desulfovibrio sp.]MTJ92878.1 hypothetical protein [Desulfovibrio sp.]